MRLRTSRLRYFAGTAMVLLVTAACGSAGGTTTGRDYASGGSDSGTGHGQSGSGGASGATVTTRTIDGIGKVLVDADGMTLYTADVEKGGDITCVDACTKFWPPLTTDATSVSPTVDGVAGKFDVVERPDQARQITLDGQPLYTFTEDRTPGSTKGKGFEDDFGGAHFVWDVVPADGATEKPAAPADDSNSDTGEGDTGDNDGGDYDY